MSQVQERFEDDFNDAPREVHLAEYWAVVVKRWRIVAVCVAAALVAAAGKTLLTTPLYRATVVINVEKDKGSPVDLGGQQYYDWYNPEFIPTQTRLMRSREIARRAAVRLNLAEDPDFVPKLSGAVRKAGAKEGPETEESGPIAQAAARVQGGVTTAPIRGTNLVELSYVALKPRTAADVANAVAEAYIEWTLEARFNMASQATKFLTAQVEQVKGEIEEKERELQAYGRQKDIVSIDPTQNVTLQKLESLNKDYAEALGDRISKEARYYELQNAKPDAMAESLSGERPPEAGAGVLGEAERLQAGVAGHAAAPRADPEGEGAPGDGRRGDGGQGARAGEGRLPDGAAARGEPEGRPPRPEGRGDDAEQQRRRVQQPARGGFHEAGADGHAAEAPERD